MTERTGLEIVSSILSPVVWVKVQCIGAWNKYVALVDVANENNRLREELRRAHAKNTLSVEERAELDRLRALLRLEPLYDHPAFAARVIAKRFGPQAALKTFTVNKGYLDGAIVGTPVVTQSGVVGRVLRTAPHASTILMVTDPGFRLAVISQKSRTPGILIGSAGPDRRLEVAYVAQNADISIGETLITAGVDGSCPKGIPVGVVTMVTPGNEILFQQVHAQPVVNLEVLEEVLLLQQAGSAPPLLERLPNPVEQDHPMLPNPQEGSLQPPVNLPGTPAPPPVPGEIPQAPENAAASAATVPEVRASRPTQPASPPSSSGARPSSRIDALQPSFTQVPPPGTRAPAAR